MKLQKASLLLLMVLLSGCSAMFVSSSPDPYKKLIQAQELMEAGRPLPSERLALDALKNFESNHDQWGIGQANGVLGLLYKSSAVEKWEINYRKNGFIQKAVTFNNRIDKALEHLIRAEKIFLTLERFETLTRARLQIAGVHQTLGQPSKACDSYREAMSSHRQFVALHPGVTIGAPSGFSSLEEFISSAMKDLKCQ